MGAADIADTALDFEHKHDHHYKYGTGAGELVCNQFVVAVLRESVDPSFPMISADEFASNKNFVKVDAPQKGDLVHFSGHIAIVTDPDKGTFIGAQTSTGVGKASYKSGWWSGEFHGTKPDYFLRWSH
jgi:hypothetical protein